MAKMRFQSHLNVICKKEFYIRALVLLNLLNSLRKRHKLLDKPHILSIFISLSKVFNKFNKTRALMYPLLLFTFLM